VVGCVEPLDKGLAAPVDERPPNLGSLDTMADLICDFSSIRCQKRHGGTWNHTQLGKEYTNRRLDLTLYVL